MITYPKINPIIVQLGPLAIRWYAVMYILSFVIGFFLLRHLIRKRRINIKQEDYENLFFYLMLGVVVGGRLGYVLFYNLSYVLHHPLELFAVWHGGMSFHGGMLCTIFFGYLFCRKHGYDFYTLADPTTVVVPIGLGLGRLGNFINGELVGRPTTLPWGMIFPGETIPRHPSQLYEFFFEGVVLFLLLFILERKKIPRGFMFWSFIFFYGVFRFLVEFVRLPDPQLGYVLGIMTMGQILSSIMILAGICGYIHVYRLHLKESAR